MTLSNGVVAKKQLRDTKSFSIKSEAAEFSGKDKSAKFIKDVIIEMETMRMEGPEAQFSYKEGTEILQSVLMRGGIVS